MYWKHPTHTSGLMSFGRRRYGQIRTDGVFEAPKDDALSARLAAMGCIPIQDAPELPEPAKVASKPTAKQLRLQARVARREAEDKKSAKSAPAAPVVPTPPTATPTTSGDVTVTVSTDAEVARLQALVEEHNVETAATSAQGLKAALTKAGVDWKGE